MIKTTVFLSFSVDLCSAANNNGAASVEDNIVPIAVGCALIGMVVVLIITYCVGRAQRTGYEKM